MSAIPITQPTSQSDAGRMVSFRLDAAIFGQLQAAAKRRKLTVSAYCRGLVEAEVESKGEEGTADVYRVALKSLEEILLVKAAILHSLKIVFQDNYNANIPLSPAELQLPADEQAKLSKETKRQKGSIFAEKYLAAVEGKGAKALQCLQEK